MSEAAIIVNNVSKKYRLFDSTRDRLKEALHPFAKHYHREFWALKDVSFEIPRGQTLGILGRNGSGKSTLLQIIAGIMQPTSGNVTVNGRVSALLELGAGFNPEFTGRENVVFQAQVMGLSRGDIDRKMPEIEEFADIGQFFDQPVKTYSSGMFVRVAFAAATNVDPDILIVDEALAVGDAKFQHKCFGTFRQFLDAGKTLVIVSHDVGTLLRLCDSGIVLEGGRVHARGLISQATNSYQALLFGGPTQQGDADGLRDASDNATAGKVGSLSVRNSKESVAVDSCDMPLQRQGLDDLCSARLSYNNSETRLGNGRLRILDYAVISNGELEPAVIPFEAQLSIYMKLHFVDDVESVSVGFAVLSKDFVYVHGTNLHMQKKPLLKGHAGEILLVKLVWRSKLVGGDYFLNLGCNQITGNKDQYLDVRRSIAHLRFADTPWCSGFVAEDSSFKVLERYPASP